MATVTTSKFLGLDWTDFLKGLVVSVLSPVFTVIIQTLEAGSLKFDWQAITITALSAFAAYILKNLLSPASVSITDVSKETVQAVKEGTATAVVVPKDAQIVPPSQPIV